MTLTISTTYTSLVILSGTADSPTTITTAGLLDAGLYAASLGAPWMIANSGSVLGAGVALASAGIVVNAGSIAGNTGSGAGVVLLAGGSVSNQSAAAISGYSGIFGGGVATIVNAGSITGTGTTAAAGVVLSAGGSVTNQSGATISGYSGIFGGGVATIVNAGSIVANKSSGAGVFLSSGGNVTNAIAGSITGSAGIEISGAAGTVVNDGYIGGRLGISLSSGGSVTNAVSASIAGNAGIIINGAVGTVVNFGAIVGLPGVFASGAGIALASGGSVTNATAAFTNYVFVSGAPGTVVNDGTIGSTVFMCISLASGGSVTNATGGLIADGIVIGYIGTVVNSGSISGGVAMGSGGSVTNEASGSIAGGAGVNGIQITYGALIVVNYGSIYGSGHGVALGDGGSVTNAASASISGGSDGVSLSAGGTLTNGGTIIGKYGRAVTFGGTASGRLVLDPGFGFAGLVVGSTMGSDTLELASAASVGTVTNLGTEFTNFGSIVLDTGADWFISGSPNGLSGTISGFAFGDTIEVSGISATGSLYFGGDLILSSDSGPTVLNLPGSFTTSDFVVHNVAAGADVSLAAPCFAAGTRICTERGEVSVEKLRESETVLVHAGDGRMVSQPIVWIGFRSVNCRRHPEPKLVWPVRIRPGAFGPGRPLRNLFLSPDHAVFVNGVLIPVKCLINDRTIAQEPVASVDYFHVELANHALVLAEGLSVESYLDAGDRSHFANGGGAVALHADFSSRTWEAEGCAPLIVAGPKLEAVRQQVNRLAAAVMGRRKPRPDIRPSIHCQ